MKRRLNLLPILTLPVLTLGLVLARHLITKSSPATTSRDAPVISTLSAPQLIRSHSVDARQSSNPPRFVETYGKLPLSFEGNRGQTDPRVKFLTRGRGYALFLTGDEAVLKLARSQEPGFRSQKSGSADLSPRPAALEKQYRIPESQGPEVLHMKLLGANAQAKMVGLQEFPGKMNYFIGNDRRKWRTNVTTFAKVKYKNVYPGVDLVYYGDQGQLEYDFVVAPGADPNAITLGVEAGLSQYEHDDNLKPLQIDAAGDLVVKTDNGEVCFHKPVVYQAGERGQFLDGRYVLLAGNRVRFLVPGYDKSKPLVIDPVLAYSTYLGGSATDAGESIAVDSSGNAYVTGITESSNFPTMNPIQSANGGGPDVFVAKLNTAGNALVYSTYLGGSGFDQGNGIAVDSSGNAYVTGFTTSSPNFPTVNPLPVACGVKNGLADVFIAKLNATGSSLVYSTCLGGSNGHDTGQGIAVDSSGNAYVTGVVASTDFPTVNPLQTTCGGGCTAGPDAFVAKLNATGNALVYSTYLGGSNSDTGSGIAVDSLGNAYVTGVTASTDFPTMNPFQPAFGGNSGSTFGDAFVAKLNAAGNALVYSTYLGGSGDDGANGIAVDSSGDAYVTGRTLSTNFPTMNPFQATCPGAAPCASAFVTKFNAAGSALVYSTYLSGGTGGVGAQGIAVDSSANAYVIGAGTVPTVNPIQAAGPNPFVVEFDAAGTALVFSTYLNGSTGPNENGIAVDSTGNIYVTGEVTSVDFPTLNAFQPLIGGGCCDAFVAKISPADASAVSFGPAALGFSGQLVSTTSPPETVAPRNVGSAPLTISNISITGTNSGDFALSGNTCGTGLAGAGTCDLSVAFTPSAPGARTAAITVTDNAGGSPQSLPLTGTGTDYSLTAATGPNCPSGGNCSTSATISAGQTATYDLQVTPNSGFNGTVALTCKGAPGSSVCSISAASVPPSGSSSYAFAVTVGNTSNAMAVPRLRLQQTPVFPVSYAVLVLLLILVAMLIPRSGLAASHPRRVFVPPMAVVLLGLLCSSGCGGGGGPTVPPPTNATLTITGASGGVNHTLSLSLTINH